MFIQCMLRVHKYILKFNSSTHTHTLTYTTVRQKTKEIIGFLQDDERLREARKVAKQTRDKYVGYSAAEASNKYSRC